MNAVQYYNLYVGSMLVGHVDTAADAFHFYKVNRGVSVYRVYYDGTSSLWLK